MHHTERPDIAEATAKTTDRVPSGILRRRFVAIAAGGSLSLGASVAWGKIQIVDRLGHRQTSIRRWMPQWLAGLPRVELKQVDGSFQYARRPATIARFEHEDQHLQLVIIDHPQTSADEALLDPRRREKAISGGQARNFSVGKTQIEEVYWPEQNQFVAIFRLPNKKAISVHAKGASAVAQARVLGPDFFAGISSLQ